MYVFDPTNMRLQRLRVQEAFQATDWTQTSSGLILPVSHPEEKEEQDIEWQPAASGIFLPVTPSASNPKKPICISLFTGAGGFDLGFHRAGWRIVAASTLSSLIGGGKEKGVSLMKERNNSFKEAP